jgi:Ni/Co efflux regulator RcnB
MFVTKYSRFRWVQRLILGSLVAALAASSSSAETKKPVPQNRPVQQSLPVNRGVQTYRPPLQNNVPVRGNTVYTRPGIAGGFARPTAPTVGIGGGFVRPSVASGGFGGPRATSRHVVVGTRFSYRGHSFRRIAGAPYRWPFGYRYTRYEVGGYLPNAFWVPDYYVPNYAVYGLDAPPPNFEWIRYGSDLLLVDLSSGSISQVVYGAYADPDGADETTDAPPDGQ